MKRLRILFLGIIMILSMRDLAYAEAPMDHADFENMFDNHGAVMLIIEPETGDILYANKAAEQFYGYGRDELLNMNVSQINTLSNEEIQAEMKAATDQKRNYFIFRHRISDGEIRTVEVYSYPVSYQEGSALFSIIYDITEKIYLEKHHKYLNRFAFIAGTAIILLLLYLVISLYRSRRRLEASRNELSNFNELRQTFIDAQNNMVYLKDESLKYVFVNKAYEQFCQKKEDEMIGRDDFELRNDDLALLRRKTDMEVIEREKLITDEVEWDRRLYRITKFPVRMLNGRFGVGAYAEDITVERERDKKQKKAMHRHMIIAEVLSKSFESREEQLDYVLNQSLELTESQYGYIYLYDEERREFKLNSWSKDVMDECAITEKMTVYQLEKTGIWGEVVRQRKPIVLNDFHAPNPHKKGYPEGHVALDRFMSFPVILDERIVAVVGLANKPSDYDEDDVYEMTTLMNGVWYAAERKEAQEQLYLERNKYLQTLISIGDAVMVVDKNGTVEMLNKVAEKLTGWPMRDATGKHYKEVLVLSRENDETEVVDPIEKILGTDVIYKTGNHAVLISKTGARYHLEDSAAPIKDDKNNTVGVVLIFRDITEQKEQAKRIEYLSFHDSLTGLYNRRFFEHELRRLDTQENLPISIIMGDINGLKLTNDIFGHAFGDILLQKISDVLRRVARDNDIVARWGGDEFVLLMTKTDKEEAENIIERIRTDYSKEKVKAIKGNISMGAYVKTDPAANIVEVLDRAEENMYAAKTLEHRELGGSVISMIMDTVHENSQEERAHSLEVSELCARFGAELNLPEGEIRKLKEVGYLHDIGKIIVDPQLLYDDKKVPEDYWSDIRKHALVGYRILNSFEDTAGLAEAVLAHHEHWDGSGYPKGLKGEEIPLLGRIISVAGTYHHMLSKEEGSLDKSKAIEKMRRLAGTRLDPVLVEAFAAMIEKEIHSTPASLE